MNSYLLVLLFHAAVAQLTFAEVPASGVRLFVNQKQVPVQESTQQQLRTLVISLLRSTSFHSGPDDHGQVFTFAGVQQDYRDAVATGEYIVVALSPTQMISTLAGDISAAEIVVGLRCPGGRNCVFTIDDRSVLTSYAKYSGGVYLQLKKIYAEQRP